LKIQISIVVNKQYLYLGSVLQWTAKLLVSAKLRPTLILRTLIGQNQTWSQLSAD